MTGVAFIPRSPFHAMHTKILPYTKELHAKLDMVKGAINDAARVLHNINSADDVGTALLTLGQTLLPAPETQS